MSLPEIDLGICEHCHESFEYFLYHCGFGDCSYAYCELCGRTSILSMWDKRWPLIPNYPGMQEICPAMESHIELCECGGNFRKGSAPRCPNCDLTLSADLAAFYIEKNAPGAKKGWRWQRSWSDLYCIVIQGKKVVDNFRTSLEEVNS